MWKWGENDGSKEDRVKGRGWEEDSGSREGFEENKEKGRWKVYVDMNDWWIGLYIGPNHLYFCVIPTIVIRFRKR
jgi:hypothetical protein